MPEYAVVVLEEDDDFDALMLYCLQMGLHLYIDPLFDLQGDLIKGYDVQPLDKLISPGSRIDA